MSAVPILHFHPLAEPQLPTAAAWAGPPRWLLALLLLLVLLAHAIALKSVWSGSLRFGMAEGAENAPSAVHFQPIQVRRLDTVVPAPAAQTAQDVAKPLAALEPAKTAEKPQFSAPKMAFDQALPAQAAINSGAPKAPASRKLPDETQTPGEFEWVVEEKLASSGMPVGLASADSGSVPGTALPGTLPAAQADATANAATPATATAASTPTATVPTAMALPASARLSYSVEGQAKGLNYFATAELDWKSDGAVYAARMTVKAFLVGQRSLYSTGTVSAQGLAPLKFTDVYRSEQAAHFEADKGLITFSANTPAKPWQPGAQDRVSVFMQLAGMLAGSQAAVNAAVASASASAAAGAVPVGLQVPGAVITLYTAGPRDADFWSFAVEAPEPLLLPYGPISALRLVRQPRREYDQKVEIWYAPALGFLPVRSRITQANGDFVDQKLSSLARGT